MTQSKSPKKISATNTPRLRASDSDRLRAEIGVLSERITARVSAAPAKAAILLAEWISRPSASATPRKKAG